MEQIIKIGEFIINSFVSVWPYLLVTIPLAVAVKISGAAKFVNKAFSRNPLLSIIMATIVGAFSPFCSCGVIPIITSLLIGGVPIAPVMSFWIASPSMDPEIFFLSAATIGWNLSVWRLIATFVISLSSGYVMHIANQYGFLGKEMLRKNQGSTGKIQVRSISTIIGDGLKVAVDSIKSFRTSVIQLSTSDNPANITTVSCCVAIEELKYQMDSVPEAPQNSCKTCKSEEKPGESYGRKLVSETWKATTMVVKFMALAFLINALISFYIPQDFIAKLLGDNGSLSVIIATLVGIPAYTTNLTALPMISGLISLGMNSGAALAFLIAGPTTTLPAMIAVWGIAKRKIFLFYISFSLIGAILFGLLYNIIN